MRVEEERAIAGMALYASTAQEPDTMALIGPPGAALHGHLSTDPSHTEPTWPLLHHLQSSGFPYRVLPGQCASCLWVERECWLMTQRVV